MIPGSCPVYAIALGLLGNGVLLALGLRDTLAAAFRTEFFIKTGVVLLGASVNLSLIVTAALPAIAQAVLLSPRCSCSRGGSAACSGLTSSCVRCSHRLCRSAG
jgi:hypothetical protein